MDASFLLEKEEILLQANATLVVKKGGGDVGGTLLLFASRLAFLLEGSTVPAIVVGLDKVTTVQVAKGGDAVNKMRIGTSGGEGLKANYVFNFTSPTKARQDRDAFRDLLAATREQRPANEPPEQQLRLAKRRASVLAGSEAVQRVHKELVQDEGGASLNEKEFWSNRDKQRLDGGGGAGATGLRSALDCELVPATGSTAVSVKYQLTPAKIRAIFAEFPAVKRAYEQRVPDKMTEKQFWTQYAASRHFYNPEDRGLRLAGQAGQEDEQLFQQTVAETVKPLPAPAGPPSTWVPRGSALDLAANENPLAPPDPEPEPDSVKTARRLNRHCSIVLQGIPPPASTARKRRLSEEPQQNSSSAAAVNLHLNNVDLYSGVRASALVEEQPHQEQLLEQEADDGNKAVDNFLAMRRADELIRARLVQDTRRRREEPTDGTVGTEDTGVSGGGVAEGLRSKAACANEFLRHYYALQPVQSAEQQAKCQRIVDCAAKLYDEIEESEKNSDSKQLLLQQLNLIFVNKG